MSKRYTKLAQCALVAVVLGGCLGDGVEGLAPARQALTTVKMDFHHRPLPEIPLPNDIATRYDPASATRRRVNASMVAETTFEAEIRELIDQLDGWGVFQPITIPFTGPLDVASILAGHRDLDYATGNDVLYLINVDRASPDFGRVHHLDLGNGNYPVVLEQRERYWKNDPRSWTASLLFEEEDEDRNGNGRLDRGEDTDADGVLDRPNYLPGEHPARDDLGARADALMTFYERASNTLIARPLQPLRERTTYAVVVTRRLRDSAGRPVGSPYPWINHTAQNEALAPLAEVLPHGLTLDDVAFAFSFTTQSIQSHMIAVRDGLYGHGVQGHLGREFPAEVASLEKLKDPDYFKKMKNPYALHTEQFLDALELIMQQVQGESRDTTFYKKTWEAQRYVDYHVIGSFESPQLFAREGADGKRLGLNRQSWPPDLDRAPAKARGERVYFWMTVPRKEISARGQGKPAPVVVLSHGYTSSRFEALAFGAYLARFGLATLAIDCASHGLSMSESEEFLARGLTKAYGVGPFFEAAIKGRAADLDGDGRIDSGGDYWTAYMFHTRDMVRQSALDYMQLIRVFRGFDGARRWKIDVNGDGKADDPAGDFDGDGVIDVGGPSGQFHMTGGSLGGIMSLFVGGIEPALTSIAPISGAAGLGEVAIRSRQGGVPEPVFLRVMGPLYVGTPDKDKPGSTKLETVVVDVNGKAELHFADVTGLAAGDTVVAENLENGQLGCSYVASDGTFRLGLESDLHDRVRLLFYRGEILAGEKCSRRSGVKPFAEVSTFQREVEFQAETFAADSELKALAEGLGINRATPRLRRFISLTQLILDPGDPIAYARNYQLEPIVYAGTGEKTGTHTLMIPTVGDMNVPVSTGVNAARAAGLVELFKSDPRHGKPVNQVLIDTFTLEATDATRRFTEPGTGRGVHMDVDNFSQGTDRFGDRVPRLDPPLRIGVGKKDALGGASAVLFPISSETGTHGFDFPGEMSDKARAACKKSCKDRDGDDPCGCEALKPFDIGLYMFGVLGNYFASGGTKIELRDCYSSDTCPDRLPVPKLRDKDSLP
jgi:hypothetical protein